VAYLMDSSKWRLGAIVAVSGLLLAGISLAIGLFTPVASLLVAAYHVLVLSFFSSVQPIVFDGKAVALRMAITGIAIALLGPGAYSLDAYLFGRREIVIPAAPQNRNS